MTERRIEVFFYGLFMDEELLCRKGILPVNARRASLKGFGLRLGTRATLVPAEHEISYGMVMGLTQTELENLYSARGLEHYRPETVTCTAWSGERVRALCYNVAEAPSPDEVDEEYAGQLRSLLEKLGFPREYVEHAVTRGKKSGES